MCLEVNEGTPPELNCFIQLGGEWVKQQESNHDSEHSAGGAA